MKPYYIQHLEFIHNFWSSNFRASNSEYIWAQRKGEIFKNFVSLPKMAWSVTTKTTKIFNEQLVWLRTPPYTTRRERHIILKKANRKWLKVNTLKWIRSENLTPQVAIVSQQTPETNIPTWAPSSQLNPLHWRALNIFNSRTFKNNFEI